VTNPNVFTVSPNVGVLQPEETAPVLVEAVFGKEVPTGKEKLLALSVVFGDSGEPPSNPLFLSSMAQLVLIPSCGLWFACLLDETNMLEFWKKLEAEKKDDITEKKLRCKIEGTASTPGVITSVPSSSKLTPEVRFETASMEAGETTDDGEANDKAPQKKKSFLKRAMTKAVKVVHSGSSPDHEPDHVLFLSPPPSLPPQ